MHGLGMIAWELFDRAGSHGLDVATASGCMAFVCLHGECMTMPGTMSLLDVR